MTESKCDDIESIRRVRVECGQEVSSGCCESSWVEGLTPSERLEYERLKLEAAKLIGPEAVEEWLTMQEGLSKRAVEMPPNKIGTLIQMVDTHVRSGNPATTPRDSKPPEEDEPASTEEGAAPHPVEERKRPGRKLKDATIEAMMDAAYALWASGKGFSMDQIAGSVSRDFDFRVSRSTVYRWIEKRKTTSSATDQACTPPKYRRRLVNSEYEPVKQYARELRATGLDYGKIAEEVSKKFSWKTYPATIRHWTRLVRPCLPDQGGLREEPAESEEAQAPPDPIPSPPPPAPPQITATTRYEDVAPWEEDDEFEGDDQEEEPPAPKKVGNRKKPNYDVPIEEILHPGKPLVLATRKDGPPQILVRTWAVAEALGMTEYEVERDASLGGWPKDGNGQFVLDGLPFQEAKRVKAWLKEKRCLA